MLPRLLLLACLVWTCAARAQTVTILAKLGGNPDGYYPQAPLVKGPDGTLYGTMPNGGAPNDGTIYKITTSGKVETMHTFNGTGGTGPKAGLVFGKDGNLYGTTPLGGAHGSGTVFRITPAGVFTVVHSFAALSGGSYGTNSGGGQPQGTLALGKDGNFYGVTSQGGSGQAGVVFKVTPTGTLTTIHTFSGASLTDIYAPQTGLTLGDDGNFYGIAQGGANSDGAIFRVTPVGALTTLYAFTGGDDGYGNDAGPLTLGTDGNFYGLTEDGGKAVTGEAIEGTAFKITPKGVLTTLHTFDGQTEGNAPLGGLILAKDGNFYGTTSNYGPANGTEYYGYGTVFRMTPKGVVTVIYTFNTYDTETASGAVDGAGPLGGVVQGSDGNFYGTTASGGKTGSFSYENGYGTVFRLTPSGTLTTLFKCVAGGSQCSARLIESPEGNFYGETARGGTTNAGTIFGVTPAGEVVTEYNVAAPAIGGIPNGGMVTDGAGNYYGFTGIDGPTSTGTLFQASEVAADEAAGLSGAPPATDATTALAALEVTRNQDGFGGTRQDTGEENQPQITKKDASTGTLTIRYGKETGGSQGSGALMTDVITKASANAAAEDLETDASTSKPTTNYSFTGGDDGGNPFGALYIDASGNAFGTTASGGADGGGTVFEYTSGGTFKTLYTFKGKSDGASPQTGVIKGTDGNFYGTTAFGSFDTQTGQSTGYGTIFKLTPAGKLTTLYTFSDYLDGSMPLGELIEGKDGNFYGSTSTGGEEEHGNLFKITPTGTLTVLHSFTYLETSDGPGAALIQGTDGNFYGTASDCVFRVNMDFPTITSAKTASATAGKAFSYAIKATDSPTSYGASGLPSGLSVNAKTGVVSGTPASTASGVKTLHLTATNAAGTGDATLTLTIAK